MKHSITAVVGPKVQPPKGAPAMAPKKASTHPAGNLGKFLHPKGAK